MIRFILRTLLGAPAWLLYFAIMLPLQLIGFPLVAVLALYMQLRFKYWGHTRFHGMLHFPAPFGLRLFYLWDNDEDGVDGDPWFNAGDAEKNPDWFEATIGWSVWRKVFVWSAWRNSVGNARRVPFLGMDMRDPKDTVVYLPALIAVQPAQDGLALWKEYRKLGPYLARYGWRFELRFPWPVGFTDLFPINGEIRYFWIGWRIAQQDTPNTNIGFAFQPWAKL